MKKSEFKYFIAIFVVSFIAAFSFYSINNTKNKNTQRIIANFEQDSDKDTIRVAPYSYSYASDSNDEIIRIPTEAERERIAIAEEQERARRAAEQSTAAFVVSGRINPDDLFRSRDLLLSTDAPASDSETEELFSRQIVEPNLTLSGLRAEHRERCRSNYASYWQLRGLSCPFRNLGGSGELLLDNSQELARAERQIEVEMECRGLEIILQGERDLIRSTYNIPLLSNRADRWVSRQFNGFVVKWGRQGRENTYNRRESEFVFNLRNLDSDTYYNIRPEINDRVILRNCNRISGARVPDNVRRSGDFDVEIQDAELCSDGICEFKLGATYSF